MANDEKSPIQPTPGYCIVIPYVEENVGGFVRTDLQKDTEGQSKGTVIAVEGSEYVGEYGASVPIPPFVKIGAVIIHKRYGHEDITIGNKKYRIIKFPEIVGLLIK